MTDSTLAKNWIGLSGWKYPEWRGRFFPTGLVQKDELHYTASRVNSIEINSSFYRLQRESTYEGWAAQVPEDFLFAVKGWKEITHQRRLNNPAQYVQQFLNSGISGLGNRLGPVLWQLPPSLEFTPDRVKTFLECLPAELPGGVKARYAIEARNETFGSETAIALLKEHNVALVMADTGGRYPQFDQVTADFVYVRLHGSPRMYYSNYSDAALESWARKIKTWNQPDASGVVRDVYFYFDNTAAGWAPYNAVKLISLVTGNPEPPSDALF